MKNTLRKTLSLFLAFTLLCSLGLTAAASEAMGEDLTSKDTLLNQKTQLSTNVFWSTAYSDLRTENVITYEPNEDVTPIVTFGDSLTTRTTVTSAARALESQGYRVVAGINGDFFNTSNGLPIGILVSEGEVLSSDGGYYAMGFREDGSAVIGKPGLSISANLGYQGSDSSGYFTDIIRTVAGINKARVSTGGIYLYTYDFNNRHTTGNTEAGVDDRGHLRHGHRAGPDRPLRQRPLQHLLHRRPAEHPRGRHGDRHRLRRQRGVERRAVRRGRPVLPGAGRRRGLRPALRGEPPHGGGRDG